MAMLRGELDWVVMKCLEKQRERRYETANGLAWDIQRYLADEVVEARPPSAGYRLKKFVRRNPHQLALAGTIVLLLVGGVSVAWWQNQQASARRETDLRRQLQDEQRASAENARLARNAEAVAALLGQTGEALMAGDAAKAAVAWRQRGSDGPTAGWRKKRTGSSGWMETWPCCAIWTPSTISAVPWSRTKFPTPQSWRRGPEKR